MALCGVTYAQSEQPKVDWALIQKQMDAVQAAVQAKDIVTASKLASQLWSTTVQERARTGPKPADYLRKAEENLDAAGSDARRRAPHLAYAAKLAFNAGDMLKAERYARETLANPSYPNGVGDSIHDGNIVLGRIALKNGDVALAKTYLLAAGKTPGTTIVKRFGPNMSLAKELAARGEMETVLAYLQMIRAMMTENQDRVDDMIALAKGGRQPDFSRFLN
jgi:hypothetical protein